MPEPTLAEKDFVGVAEKALVGKSVEAIEAATGQRLPLYDASGELLGDRLLLESTVDVQ